MCVCVCLCVCVCYGCFKSAQFLGHVWPSVTLWTVACQVPLSMRFPGKNTGVGCHFLQGIFLTQGSNPHLLHWKANSLSLSHLGSNIYIYTYIYIRYMFICYLSIRILNIKMKYYSALRTKEILPFVTIWMTLESMMLSEKSARKRQYYVISHICEI